MSIPLAATLTTNTSTDAADWSGDGTLFISGNFAAGTAKLQLSPDAGLTWIDATDEAGVVPTLTASGAINFSTGNCKVRANLTGATVAAGTAQIETRTPAGPAAAAAGVTVSLLRNPSVGDVLRIHTTPTAFLDFTFVDAGATGNQVNLGANSTLTATALRAKLVATGRPCTGTVTTLILASTPAGVAGNGWSVGEFPVEPGNHFLSTDAAPYTGGRETGTLAASGNVTVTVVGNYLPVTPRVLTVPVMEGDTLSEWTDRIRQALIMDPGVNYTIGGTGANITLTRPAPFAANDGTLNVAIANGVPSPGVTVSATSTNTTAGVATTPSLAISLQPR